MQTKKRAKPVKFEGKKSVTAVPPPLEHIAEETKEDIVIPPNAATDEAAPHEHRGIEAHFSSTVETFDIEIPESPTAEKIEAQEEEKMDEVVPTSKSVSAEQADVNPSSEAVEEVSEDSNLDEAIEEGEAIKDQSEQSDDSEDSQDSEESNNSVDSNDSGEVDPLATEQDGEFFNRPPDEYDKKKSGVPYFFRVFIITFLVGLAFFGGIYYTNLKKSENDASSKKSAEVTESPTPTQVSVDLTKYNIKVLNGTAVSGIAAKVKTDLAAAGFKPESTGNATTQDFTKSEIAAKKTVDKAYLTKLKEFLVKTYVVGDVIELANGDSDVVVTIGTSAAK